MAHDVIPQLRVRTEYSFREAFGPVRRVAAALKEIGAPSAGIVDGDTWGHVRWAAACSAEGVRPAFGCEFSVRTEDGKRPAFWVLAERGRLREFYRYSTLARAEGFDHASTIPTHRPGLVFAGAALKDPALFDYIDLNPSSPLVQRAAMRLAAHTNKPIVLTSDNAYARRADYAAFMAMSARERVTPQHLLTVEEMRAQFGFLSDGEFERAVRNTHEAAERCEFELARAPIISVEGDLRARIEEGIRYRISRGHILSWTPEHQERLERELLLIHEKSYESYFLVVADLISWAKTRMLVGPGRGSSAGSLVCYLLRITEVNPLPHHLLFERFIDVTRSDLPDIDIDFSDVKRDECFTYLADKYGKQNVARIGNVATLKPRSAMAEVGKRLGIPSHEMFALRNVLIEYSSGDSRFGNSLEDTLTTTDVGRSFMKRYPAAKVLWDVENHAWHTGVHAAGVIVSNEAISDYCTVGPDGVAHIDKLDAEKLGLLKIDALGLRTLGVIEDAGVVSNDELYDIAQKLDDPEVFKVFNEHRFAGVFQFEGQAMRRVCEQVHVSSFRQVDHITALARPGPLGGGAAGKYFARAAGREPVEFLHPSMAHHLEHTLGVILYQEQVMRIGAEVGKLSWREVTLMRKAMSGRKGNEFFGQVRANFLKGAVEGGVPQDVAEEIWSEINTFGAWGMNASHTVSYSVVSYWCAWMKRYYPLEYAAACLRNAKDDDQTVELLRELDREGVSYVPFDPDLSDVNWRVLNGKLIGGFTNLKGYGAAKAVTAVEHRRLGVLSDKERERIAAAEVKFKELYPLRKTWASLYENPEAHGCRAGSKVLTADQFPEEGDVLYLGLVVKKERRDENETVRQAKRGYALKGNTLFVDMTVKDDSGIPIIVRIGRKSYEPIGRLASERIVAEEDVVLVRGRRIPGFPMIRVDKIKCLNRPEVFQE